MISPAGRSFAFALLGATAALAASTPARAREGDMPTLQQAIGDPDDFRLSGSTRLRYEALGGQTRVGFSASEDVFSIRTIVTGEYRTGDVRIGAELYDSRTYGIEPGSSAGTGEVNTVELVQAHVTVDLPAAFGKGSKAYNRYQGDAHVTPNPCVAPIETGPYYAIKLVIGDIGTFAGLATDENTRVLDASGKPIKGLYAVGNDAASVMGGNYPGAGITLGPAVTFGYVAAMQLAKTAATADIKLQVERREPVAVDRRA